MQPMLKYGSLCNRYMKNMGYRRVVIGLVLCIVLIMLPAASILEKKSVSQIKTIVIDAGHGGLDPGCNGANEIWEKAVTLSIALKLGKFLEDSLKDVQVLYTRKTDKFVELWERPNLANKNKADLFISIHCNSNTNVTAAGSETYFMGLHKTQGNLDVAKRENASIKYEANYQSNEKYGGFDPNSPEGHIIFTLVQNAFIQQSLRFSTLVENNTAKLSKIKSRGVKQAGFLVLWQTAMPSVLVETGFLTNSADRAYLKTDEGQKNIAKGVYFAIKSYKREVEKKVKSASTTAKDSATRKP
jgi:N-acetylmuramoyl-L-alanine amidase